MSWAKVPSAPLSSSFRRIKDKVGADYLCFGGMIVLSLFFGWLLSLAYPEGICNGETPGYWNIAKDFEWFKANPVDWLRTIPYGAVLTLCSGFPQPSVAAYWINTLLFALNSALVFVLGKALFSSRLMGLVLALSALFVEVACMRTFFQNLLVTADPFFAELVYAGVLLSLIGWLTNRPLIFTCAYAIFGIAIFTKPAGVSILPVWTVFAFMSWWPKERSTRLLAIALSLFLMFGPIVFWSVRNYYVYGSVKSAASGGCSLLLATLPFVSDGDQLFDDPEKNSKFITAVRECEKTHHIDWKIPHSAWDRQCWYEYYFKFKEELSSPFEFIAKSTVPPWPTKWPSAESDSTEMFKVDAIANQIAWRIIRAHPKAFLERLALEYMTMFSPFYLPTFAWERYRSDPEVAYLAGTPNGVQVDFSLYPGTGVPNASLSNKKVAESIGKFIDSFPVRELLGAYYNAQFWLSHFIFIGAIVYCFAARKLSQADQKNSIRIAIVLIMLFLTTACNYFAVAFCQVARFRYAIAGGDIQLHLLFLILLLSIARHLAETLANHWHLSVGQSQASRESQIV